MINHDPPEVQNHDLYDLLGFTEDWLEFLTINMLDELRKELVPNEEPNPGHFKWKVFNLVLQQPGDPAEPTLTALYALAIKEPNPKLRDTFVCAVIRHTDCPEALLDDASTSGTGYIADIARRRQQDPRA